MLDSTEVACVRLALASRDEDLIARAALDGMSAQMGAAGVDLGALEEAPAEEAAEA
mgnify:CR=1 FL=1